ncbi:hypothetical protein ABWI00_19640 [Algihabitans albus]|uniref:hypothetical protein n=1 Tax=Algihabitans albus TaxID=2164067 RepID=UPI0035D0BCF6
MRYIKGLSSTTCATGTVPYRLDVRVLDFEDQNVGQAIMVGAAMMSDAEKSLSREFAVSVCEEVFGQTWDPED